jgi:phage-related protein
MPLSAGTVYVDVKPDTTQMTSKSGGLSSAMKTAGFLAAGAFAVSFVKGGLEEAKEAEKVGLMFADSMSRGTENFNADKLSAQFDKINNALGTSDEELQQWSAQLNNAIDFNQFGKNSEKMMVDMTKLIPNLAAQSGKSTSMVAKTIKTIGTAPESAITALRKLGGITDEQALQAEKLIKHGKVQEAQAYLVESATKASAGAAAKQTTATEKLSIMWSELQEVVGTKLLPVLNDLAERATKMISWLTGGSTSAKVFMYSVLGIAGAMLAAKAYTVASTVATTLWTAASKAASAASKVWTAAQWAWNAAMTANPIGLIVAAVIALIALVVILWKKNETFRRIVIAAWNAVKTAVLVVWNAIKAAAIKVFNFLKTIVTGYINFYKAVFSKAWEIARWVFDKVLAVVRGAWDKIKTVWNGTKAVVKAVADAWFEYFRTVFNGIASLWNNTVGKLSFSVPDWVPKIGGNGWDVPDIPMLADGGIVTKPTLAVVGEAGPEAVIPLSGGGAGAGMTVRIVDSNLGLVMDGRLERETDYRAGHGRMAR